MALGSARVAETSRATPRVAQGRLEMPHAFVKDVHPAQQLELIEDIIALFGDRETSTQSHACQLRCCRA